MTIQDSLRRIDGLIWRPWIGEEYFSCQNPVMVLGESHYVHDGLSREDIDCDPDYTSDVVREYVVGGRSGGKQWRMYEPLEHILRGACFKENAGRQNIWNELAYMNIIQHVLVEKSGGKKWEDFLVGWRVILQVVHILKPRIVVCFSTDKRLNRVNFNRLPEFKDKVDFEYEITPNCDSGERIGRIAVASPGGIAFDDGTKVPVIFLEHASRIKNYDAWRNVLRRNRPSCFSN